MSLLQINASNFETEVFDSPIPVIVDFFAPWCGPCKVLAPLLEQIQTANPTLVKVVKVDVEECDDLAKLYGVRGVPTLIFFEQDSIVGQKVGMTTKTDLIKAINKHFNIELV